MTKIHLFNFSFEWWARYHTFLLEILNIEVDDSGRFDSSLFEIGWYQGVFILDLLFINGIKRFIEDYLERRN